MTSAEGYPTAAGVEAAIKAAAQSAVAKEPALSIAERIRLESFRRFLAAYFPTAPNPNGAAPGFWPEYRQPAPPATSICSARDIRWTRHWPI